MFQNKMKKTLIITSIAGSLLFTSACAGNSDSDSPSASSETSSAPVVVDGVEYGPTIEGMPTLKELASDKNGEWRKTAILPDDKAFTFNPAVVDATAKDMWSDEEIKAAQKMSVEMIADMIDTPANGALGDSASMVEWWEVNKDKFHPNWKQAMYNAAISTDVSEPIVYKADYRQDNEANLEYGMPYGENEIHVKDRIIETSKIFAGELPAEGNAIEITSEVFFSNVVEIKKKKNVEKVSGDVTYTMTKDEDTGEFLIAGFDVKLNYKVNF